MDDHQLMRYSRQLLLPQFDVAGQERLLGSKVLIIGLGGLGAPAAIYLAAAGVGELVVNDDDRVDLSNLQRQIIHGLPDLGRPKVESARDALTRLNPDCRIRGIDRRLQGDELAATVAAVDLVLDCSDNFATRFAVNSACVASRKPLVSGAVIRFEGQLAVFEPGRPDSPCYNCLYGCTGEPMESCARSGVLAPVPGIIGSMQALEAIKVLTGVGQSLCGSLLLFDALVMEWRRIRLPRNPACPTCGKPGPTAADGATG